jgi:hypothetical protein
MLMAHVFRIFSSRSISVRNRRDATARSESESDLALQYLHETYGQPFLSKQAWAPSLPHEKQIMDVYSAPKDTRG